MSVIEPSSSDDEFFKLVAGLEVDFNEIEVRPITEYEDKELASRYAEVRTALMDMGQLIHQSDQSGRDLASELAAIRHEIKMRTGRS